MKYAWITDCHLDHLNDEELKLFHSKVRDDTTMDTTLLVTGDITVARRLFEHIDGLGQAGRGKMLYVLGNHDRWGSSLAQCTRDLRPHGLPQGHSVFMDLVDRIQLEEDLCVVGDSGWYDGRNGLQGNPRFLMNDWFYIQEYRGKNERMCSAEIADKCAKVLEAKLRAACEAKNNRVIVLTHVPPYTESALYMGRPGDDYAQPWFTSRAIGDVLDQVAKEYFHVKFEVLCGHTHDRAFYKRDDNLVIHTGAAQYGDPRIVAWTPTLW